MVVGGSKVGGEKRPVLGQNEKRNVEGICVVVCCLFKKATVCLLCVCVAVVGKKKIKTNFLINLVVNFVAVVSFECGEFF